MDRNDALHALSVVTAPTQEGMLVLVRALASRWPDRAIIKLANELQEKLSRRIEMSTYNDERMYTMRDANGHLVEVMLPDFTPEDAIIDLYVRTFKKPAPDSWQEALREIDVYLNPSE